MTPIRPINGGASFGLQPRLAREAVKIDGQRGELEEIARRRTRGSRSVLWGGIFLALLRARSDRKAGSGPGPLRGEYGFLGRRRSVGSIKRCQNDVSRRKPGDTEATRAVCDSFCDFVGFLILAARTPLIRWGRVANYGWGGIEPAFRFRSAIAQGSAISPPR
jgi:hypothetical protein